MTIGEAWARHRFALALLALAVAILFAPSLAQREVFTFRDHSDYFQPLRYFTAQHMRYVLPYWNPYSASGEPWLANPQTGLFYPPTWLFALLPFETAYQLYLALHLLILGWGAYLLFARFVSPGAALLGATVVTFCGPTMSLVDVSNNLCSFAWVPLVMWCAIVPVAPELAAVVIAMAFLAGEPFFASIAALLYAVTVRDYRKVLVAGAGAFGLSAIQLFPFVEMLRGSDRAAGLAPAEIFRESMRVSDWLRVAVPPSFGAQPLDPHLSQHFIPIIYVGIPAVVLAVIALMRGGQAPRLSGQSRAPVLQWLLLLLFAIVVASGPSLLASLPLTLFRYPARVVPFGALAIAALAAIGWDRVRPNRRWLDLAIVLIIVVDLLPRESLLLTTRPFTTNFVPYSATIGRAAKVIRVPSKPITNRSIWIAGYLNLYQRRFDASTAAPVVNDRYLRLHDAAIGRVQPELVDLIDAGYILADRPMPLPSIARVGPVSVYVNRTAPPMATFFSRAVSYPSAEAAFRAATDTPDRYALFVWPPIDARFRAARPFVLAAASTSLDAFHARVVVEAPHDGVVVLTQQDFPAWHVFVDGVESKKLLAAGIFRAVEVREGRHEIVWRYRSRSFFFGTLMTIITAASLAASIFVKRAQTKKYS
ncbi:MAG TPA: hypothetical protein VLU46_05875 [Thermoanaerobaculia bacterium]|nr:hypothetical protein [Thermoanaerobaculia bacterium]